MRSPAFRFATGLAVLLLVIAGVAAAVVGYKIASLKADLAQNLGRALGAKVDVTTLEIDLQKGEIHAAGITLANLRPDAPWDRGEISQATLRFHLLDLFSSSLPLTVEVSSWSVVLHPHGQGQEAPAPSATPGSGGMEPGSRESPSKRGVHVTQLTARDGEVDFDLEAGRQIVIRGVSFNSSDNGAGVWTTQLQAGSVSAGTLQAGPGSVEIEADRDKATFSDFRLQCGSGGVTGDGDLALGAGQAAHMDLKLADVPVSMLVPIEWQMKLSGLANGSLRYARDGAAGTAQGQLAITHAKFDLLPFLGKMTQLFGLPDIAETELDTATTDFTWQDHALHLTNIDVRKNGVIRVAGDADVAPDGQVDGRLKVGLPAPFAARWPQIQSAVFSVTSDDFCWAQVHVTGTPDHLEEDLTPRLLAVGLQSGGSLLNQTGQKTMDLLKSIMGP